MSEKFAASLWEMSMQKLEMLNPNKLSAAELLGYKEYEDKLRVKKHYKSDWISPFDSLHILSESRKLQLSNFLVVDQTGGNFAVEFLQIFEIDHYPATITVLSENLSTENYRTIASSDHVIAILGHEDLDRAASDADAVVARFNTSYNKFELSSKTLNALLSSENESHLFLHEYYPDGNYPFQYYFDSHMPILLDVIQLLVTAKRFEFLGDTWSGVRSLDPELQDFLRGKCKSTLIGHFKTLKNG